MEKRIKILYCITIVAILLFLGMQVYWLYGRYEYSLTEYENEAEQDFLEAIDSYRLVRDKHTTSGSSYMTKQSTYNLNTEMNDDGSVERKVGITIRKYNGREILGIKEQRNLTKEEMEQLANIFLNEQEPEETESKTIDASGASSDAIAWKGIKNLELEIDSPFKAEGLDSMLNKRGYHTDISLVKTDSMLWDPELTRHSSVFSPRLSYMFPYSELDNKSVIITCKIPISEIISKMTGILCISVLLSVLLILCLAWQFSTILRLNRLDNLRNSFITTMIHELKRPISTLKMCVSGLDNEFMMNDRTVKKEILSETRNALDNLSSYFSKLRDITFNKVEQIPLNLSSVELHSLFENVAKGLDIPGGKSVILKNEIPEELYLQADRSHLYNIINNIVENAVKYSGKEVIITVSAETGDNFTSINISDNGNGIANADKGKIFDQFYRGKASAYDLPGLGLGLAYVRLLVEAHEGKISVDSTEGQGTTFTISLPR